MYEIDKIKTLAKEQGKSMSYICSKIGKANNYLSDINSGKGTLSESVLVQIADILNTTSDYLTGKTDKKNKPTTMGELDELDYEFIRLFHSAPEEARKSLLDLLRHL